MPATLERHRHRLNALEASLRALNPEAVMGRGYAVLRQGGAIVDSVQHARPDLPLWINLADGTIQADIADIIHKDG